MNNYYIIGHDYNGKYADMTDWEGNDFVEIQNLSASGKINSINSEKKNDRDNKNKKESSRHY